jgi:hypothetical protein
MRTLRLMGVGNKGVRAAIPGGRNSYVDRYPFCVRGPLADERLSEQHIMLIPEPMTPTMNTRWASSRSSIIIHPFATIGCCHCS